MTAAFFATGRRFAASGLAAVLLLALTSVGVPTSILPGVGPSPALAIDPSRGTPGPCPDDTGVTVVVDFQQVGSREVIVRCSPSAEGTGLDALRGAGFQVEGVRRWGDSFICRIEATPAPGETLPVRGDENYTEACIDTPPAAAYWSYWHAANGGSWEYSQWGVKNRSPIPGGFEGWSFSLNATADSNPAPRFSPVREDDGTGPGQPAPTTGPGTGSPAPTGGGPGDGAGGGGSGSGAGGDEDSSGSGDSGAGAGSDGDSGRSDAGSGDRSAGAATGHSGDEAAAPAPLPRQARDGDEDTADDADGERAGAPTPDAADSTGEVPWSGGEHLAADREADEGGTGGWLGIPSGVWWTVLAALVLLTLAATAARRRSGRTA